MTPPAYHDYLGDAVYAHYNVFGDIVLRLNDHENQQGQIVLEPEVYASLVRYAKRLNEALGHQAFMEKAE